MSHLSQRPDSAPDSYEVGKAIPHESAALHVTGLALYTDDLVARTKDCLHAYPLQAPYAHARVTRLRTKPALDVPGVVRVLTAEDVPVVLHGLARGPVEADVRVELGSHMTLPCEMGCRNPAH